MKTSETMNSIDVLLSPGGPSLNSASYGKEYYLLEHIAKADAAVTVDGYFKTISDRPPYPNISVREPDDTSTRNRYYIQSFIEAREELKANEFDVYHHLNFHYRFFNPLLLTNQIEETPVVLGPAQPPHDIPDPSKRRFINEITGVDWPDVVLDELLPVANWIQENIYNNIKEALFAKTLARADRIVVVNEETAELYANYVDRSKIDVIPYGVVSDRFIQGDPSQSMDLVAIGSLFERKGFDLLIKAWAEIAAEYPETTVHIYGDGPQRDVFESLAHDLGVNDSISFHGRVEHSVIEDALANARAFVHPSRSEGFPHVRLESMASGCPVVASNVWGTNEMIRDGIDGLVVPRGSVTELSDAMSTVLAEPVCAREMGQNARTHVEQQFNWNQIGQQFAKLYRELSE